MWCKNCLKGLKSLDDRHHCKNENIDRLMRRRGWKYCPGNLIDISLRVTRSTQHLDLGCRTPVQKESGCNHMTVSINSSVFPPALLKFISVVLLVAMRKLAHP